jgi:hypothetical protein
MVGKVSISVEPSEALRFLELLNSKNYGVLGKMHDNGKIAFAHKDGWTVFYFDIETWVYLYDNI